MEVKEIDNRKIWENFLLDCQEKTFLQSWNWGEFNKLMGNKIWRFGIYKNDELVSLALVVKIEAKRGRFLLLPHAPILSQKKGQELKFRTEILKVLIEKLKEIGKKERAIFIRVAPIWPKNLDNEKIFKNCGFRKAPIHIHPEITWELDITKSEEDLLMGMRKTTRYLIRKAQKNSGIKIYKYFPSDKNNLEKDTLNALEIFYRIYFDLAGRQHFVPFSFDYLKNELLAFAQEGEVSLFLGKYKEEILAGGIFVFWQEIGFYHHGASLLKYPKIPISYLLQWEAIKEAKRRGCKKFNFWGIAPISKENLKLAKHPWTGLTLFKMGFGGYKKEYLETQDLPLSKRYWLNYLIERWRKIKRGF